MSFMGGGGGRLKFRKLPAPFRVYIERELRKLKSLTEEARLTPQQIKTLVNRQESNIKRENVETVLKKAEPVMDDLKKNMSENKVQPNRLDMDDATNKAIINFIDAVVLLQSLVSFVGDKRKCEAPKNI